MRRILVALTVAAFLVLAPVGTALAASSSASAAPITTVTHRSGFEYYAMPASMCTFMRKSFPALTRNPKLCQFEHGWTETTTTLTSPATTTIFGAGVAQASSCPTGTQAFHDWVNDATHLIWQYDLDTSFTLSGCHVPTLNYENCYYEYANNTTWAQPTKCYSYHYYAEAGWDSTAAVETVYPCTSLFGNTTCSTDSQRRECYSNVPTSSCNWTAWQGA